MVRINTLNKQADTFDMLGGFELPENATSYVSAKSLSSLFSEVAAFSADTPLPDAYAKLDGLRLASPNFDFRDNDATRPYLAVKMTDALQARWTEYAKGIYGIRTTHTPTPSFTLSKYNTGDWSLKLNVPTSPGYPSTALKELIKLDHSVNSLTEQ